MRERDIVNIIATFAMLPFIVVWHGYALTILWAWFITPTFSLPLLTIPEALGIVLTTRFISNPKYEENKGKSDWGAVFSQVIYSFAFPAMALLIGWIITLFMVNT